MIRHAAQQPSPSAPRRKMTTTSNTGIVPTSKNKHNCSCACSCFRSSLQTNIMSARVSPMSLRRLRCHRRCGRRIAATPPVAAAAAAARRRRYFLLLLAGDTVPNPSIPRHKWSSSSPSSSFRQTETGGAEELSARQQERDRGSTAEPGSRSRERAVDGTIYHGVHHPTQKTTRTRGRGMHRSECRPLDIGHHCSRRCGQTPLVHIKRGR